MEKTDLFWTMYDKYIQTKDHSLRKELSGLLSQIEKKSRQDQLLRPEKGWNKILAWQVLRNQSFVFVNHSTFVHEGEIIIWFSHWDRDVFISRIPKEEFVSGAFLKPGFCLSHDDKGDMSDHEWREVVLCNGITDERGLYLPLYTPEVVLDLCDDFISEKREEMLKYLKDEKF